METLRFKDFKNLVYPDVMPVNQVLADLMYKGLIDVNTILSCYTTAIERERHLNAMRFEEACVNLTQMLGDNFKGKNKNSAIKRAIHTFNLNKTLVPHIHDSKYSYTEDDERVWDDFCKTIYGTDLKNDRRVYEETDIACTLSRDNGGVHENKREWRTYSE